MCINCKEKSRKLPLVSLAVIEAHRAEIMELIGPMETETQKVLGYKIPADDANRDTSAIMFLAYVAGYLNGLRAGHNDATLAAADMLFQSGLTAGYLMYGAREYDEEQGKK